MIDEILFVVNENENGCCECFLNLSEQGLRAVCEVVREVVLLGSLSNKDGDGNENGKKATGLDWQNNNFARASRFFGHFIRLI